MISFFICMAVFTCVSLCVCVCVCVCRCMNTIIFLLNGEQDQGGHTHLMLISNLKQEGTWSSNTIQDCFMGPKIQNTFEWACPWWWPLDHRAFLLFSSRLPRFFSLNTTPMSVWIMHFGERICDLLYIRTYARGQEVGLFLRVGLRACEGTFSKGQRGFTLQRI